MELSLINWLVGIAPILAVLVLMLRYKWKGSTAGLFSWVMALILAGFVYQAGPEVLIYGSLKGIWTTVFVLYIIWAALTLYHIVNMVGGFKTIAHQVASWTGGSKLIQLLVVGWAFPSFIQGVCGFGTPVAVAAPLLVGLGFHPLIATTTALIGHSWAVTFGTLGSSYAVMLRLTGLEPGSLAFFSSIFLSTACLITGLIILSNYRSLTKRLLKEEAVGLEAAAIDVMVDGSTHLRTSFWPGLKAVFIIGFTMAASTLVMANFVSPYVASLVAGMSAIIVGSFVLPKLFGQHTAKIRTSSADEAKFHIAFSAYYILLAVVFAIYLTPLKGILDAYQIGLPFPETVTGFGHVNPAVKMYSPIKIFTAPGTLIFLSAVAAIAFYRMAGLWKAGMESKVVKCVARDAIPASLTVVFMSMLAVVMVDTGMMTMIAKGIADFSGRAYPIFAPIVGGLGAFMTGSNTSSNILFSVFQKNVADILAINSVVILGLQTTGGALGNMFSPMNIALGTSVTNTIGSEGKILSRTLLPGILACLIVGVLGLMVIGLGGL